MIGFGYWGPNWARTIEENSSSTLTAIVDSSNSQLAKAKKLHPGAKLLTDVSGLLGMGIDVAVVATPPSSHIDLTKALARAGVPTLLIEKPLALSVEGVTKIYEIADEFGLQIVVDYPFLYSQAVRTIGQLLRDSPTPDYVESQRHNLGIFRPDMSVLWDLTVHDLSIFDFLFGPLEEIQISCSTTNSLGSPHASSGLVQIRGRNIPQLVSSVSWISPAKIRRLVSHSAKRMIAWDDTNQLEPLKVFETDVKVSEQALLQYRVGNSFAPSIMTKAPLETLLEELIHSPSVFDFAADRARTFRITKALELAVLSENEDSRFISSSKRSLT